MSGSVINTSRTVEQTLYLFRPGSKMDVLSLLERRMYYSNVAHTMGRKRKRRDCVEGRGPDDDARP